MALSTSCCLNLPPPTSSSNPSSSSLLALSKTNRISWQRKEEKEEEKRSWRRQCFLGMAFMIIGFEMVPLSSECCAFAEDLKLVAKTERWSDRRKCPPWRMNSLETIVPEDLPRPSAHRNFEGVAHPLTAPSVRVLVKASRGSCFSL